MADIKVTSQNIEITGVGDVIITPVVQDPVAGDYVRDIRIFETPATLGGSAPMLLQVRIRSTTEAALSITSPQHEI